MGDALSCALMDARDFKASDFAQFHPGGTLGRRLLTKAKDIMRTEDLPIIPPSMPLGEAVIHVSNGRLGLCVAQEEGKIVGIITDGDIRRAIQASRDNFFRTTVAEVMTRTPKTVSPEAKVSEIESISPISIQACCWPTWRNGVNTISRSNCCKPPPPLIKPSPTATNAF